MVPIFVINTLAGRIERVNEIRMVHGIRTWDGGLKSFSDLKNELSFKVDRSNIHVVDYGYILFPITNERATSAIINSISEVTEEDQLIIIGYSNGSWGAVQVAEMGYPVDHLVLINPALHCDYEFPEQIKRIDVYYSSDDFVVSIGKMLMNVFSLVFGRWWNVPKWGEMGKIGYKGNDSRIHNHDMGDVNHFFYDHKAVALSIAADMDLFYENIYENQSHPRRNQDWQQGISQRAS